MADEQTPNQNDGKTNDDKQPIVIKKIYKKAGHHGGAWKVAFADFTTAMMAFFLLLWLLGTTSEEERGGISEYLQNPRAVPADGGTSVSIVDFGGSGDGPMAPEELQKPPPPDGEPVEEEQKEEQPEQVEVVEKVVSEAELAREQDKQRLEQLLKTLTEAIGKSQALKPFKDQLLLDITPQGLRVQIIDQQNRSMFGLGSARLEDFAAQILVEIGNIINAVPNKVSITGHTDSRPFTRAGYSNWELSSARANAARRALVTGGMEDNKVAQVVGLASSALFDKEDPLSAINRRISIIVLKREIEQLLERDQGETALEQLTEYDIPLDVEEVSEPETAAPVESTTSLE
ncbi:MAG: flagellar motor protein MotB [Gammaproteobacteria bacterium]|nr:flagellar motor protein MotB [Gammaproteobacteria bacterium]